MFISKKHLSRRSVLKGVGAAVALPLLDAMVPARTALAQTAAAPTLRFGTIYIPHGAIMDVWMPKKVGTDFELPIILKPLESLRSHFNVVTGLYSEGANAHSACPGFFSACAHAPRGNLVELNTSIDQVIAQKIGQGTTFPSMELAIEDSSNIFGTCAADFLCTYMDTISWRTPTQPLPMEHNPRKVFIQLFGEGDTPQERTAISDQTRSLLDRVRDRINAMRRDLSAGDRVILDNYVETVREIERRVQLASSRDLSGISVPEAPIGELNQFGSQVDLLFDLIALAYQADLTRVASYIMVAEGTNRTYNHIGVSDSFHPVSHHANDLSRIEKLVKIQTWHVERFAAFMKKLSAIPDGDGSLLDHSMFLYGSNMSNSDRHNGHPLPTILVGGGNGTLKGSQHIDLREPTPLANVHLTILDKINAKQDSFGDSTGLIAGV